MFPPIEETLASITGATTLDELKRALARISKDYGLTLVAYQAAHRPEINPLTPLMLLSSDDDLARQYLEHGGLQMGSVFQSGRSGFLPYDWDQAAPEAQDARAVFHEAGVRGMTIPIRGPGGEHARLSIAANVTAEIWSDRRMTYMRDFLIIAHFIHDQAVQLAGLRPQGLERLLSARERETLQLAARGFSPKQIAADLHLSSTAVRLYLQGARSKLECATLMQSIARAVSLDIIEA
ncbi:helix-turn-helix transcriptional regulator [Bradyrhizobium sp.]|jgi:DNA-binding CsgD family transcriptional regulator|uniref:helix-turn-helix transcriptional regulator n=1 Tax=Bradyrhizobium sp. TaxID=376 RepID=UPI002DDC9713|nr:autoinducer binding domain-containing protein [Bradyrhizobium sp.]HEV2153204.1 autoinducer binding domain-containing protein [Bradyrhizobium sp.]